MVERAAQVTVEWEAVAMAVAVMVVTERVLLVALPLLAAGSGSPVL